MKTGLINLTDATIGSAKTYGGKFFGLVQIRDFVKKFSKKYNIDYRIPKTFATPCYNVYLDDNKKRLKDITESAARALELCGGNVAVRSSANVEDAAGRTFSGCFESVLNVKNTVDLESAVYKVLMSLSNPTVLKEFSPRDLSMGIVIQEMIDMPDKAGVVYSEGFECQPYIPISYTTNKLADKLVMGQEPANSFIVMKLAKQLNPYDGVRFLPNMINNPNYRIHQYDKGVKLLTDQQVNDNKDLLNLAGFASATEQFFDHDVDIEFAIKNGITYILQQRPYIMPQFKSQKFGDYCMSIYNPKSPIIKGFVLFLNNEDDDRESDIVILKDDGFLNIQQSSYKDIASSYALQENAYNHPGNNKRESVDKSCFIIFDNPYFPGDLKTGDYIELNLKSGALKTWKTSKERSLTHQVSNKNRQFLTCITTGRQGHHRTKFTDTYRDKVLNIAGVSRQYFAMVT